MRTRLVWAAFACMAAMAASANAQDTGPVVIHREVRAVAGEPADVMYHPEPIGMEFLGAEMSFGDKPVKGAPYAAEAVTETTQTLADGNRITRKSSANVYRDSAGRTRREETISALGPWAAGLAYRMLGDVLALSRRGFRPAWRRRRRPPPMPWRRRVSWLPP